MIPQTWLRRLFFLLGVVTILLLTAGLLSANPLATTIDWSSVNSGGGSFTNGNITLNATIGEPAAGLTTAGNSSICAGFLCSPGVTFTPSYHLYLPSIPYTNP